MIVLVGAACLLMGKIQPGMWLILSDVGVVAAIFVGGKLIQRKERRDRRAELESGGYPEV